MHFSSPEGMGIESILSFGIKVNSLSLTCGPTRELERERKGEGERNHKIVGSSKQTPNKYFQNRIGGILI